MLLALLVAVSAPPPPPEPPVPTEALPTLGEFAIEAAATLAWPLQLEPIEAGVLATATIGTVALLRTDTQLYGRVRSVRVSVRKKSVFDYTLLAGDGLVDLALVGAFAFDGQRGIRTAMAGANALAAVALTSVLMKAIFRVPRPQADPFHKRYFTGLRSDAFPSGHTMSAFATATVIADAYPQAAIWSYAAACVVGLSVMKRGWHWPSDVLAGGALGFIIGRVATRVSDRRFAVELGPGTAGMEVDF